MAETFSSIIPNPEDLLALEPEDLAGVILEYFNSSSYGAQHIHPQAFCAHHGLEGYPQEHWERISQALMEAWVWLEREGLIARNPDDFKDSWYFITRRGKLLKNRIDLETDRKANLLPKEILHPVIAQKVRPAFIRGEYDTTVFQAFKEVEIAVRRAGGFAETDLGVKLMRKAFDLQSGPLTDDRLPDDAEKEAMSHLFAGAIGLYKNPQSHRHVSITDPAEAVALITLASHLIYIVDYRMPDWRA